MGVQQAYNSTKHDRHGNFPEAKFTHLIEAMCGLTALIASQFYTQDFAPAAAVFSVGGGLPDHEPIGGNFFCVKFPVHQVAHDDRYDFQRQPDNQYTFQYYPY